MRDSSQAWPDPAGSADGDSAGVELGAAVDERVASSVAHHSAAEFAALELRIAEAEACTWRLLQAIPDPLVVLNADNVIELINTQAVLLFGYQREELVGQPVERLFPAGVHATLRRHCRAELTSPLTTGSIVMGVRKDGQTVQVEVNLSAITLATGPAMLASIRDVSERTMSEEELRISDERFRVSFDWAPIGMGLIDLRPATVGHFLRVNPALCRLTGHLEADLLETSSMAITHPADRAETAANLQRLVDGGASRWDTDKRYLSKSGRDIWVHFAVTVVHDASGNPSYGVSQVEDITDRKLAESQLQERFHALANNVDVGFMIRQLDPPEFVYFNPAYLRIFGYDPTDPPPTPAQAMASVHPDDLERVSTVLANAAQGRRVEQEWRFTRLDGQLRWASGRVSPVIDQDGQIRLVAGVFTDITDRKNAAAILAESQEQFRELADNVDVGFSIRDAGDSRYLYLNPRFLSIFGFDPTADWPTLEEVIARRHSGSDHPSAGTVPAVVPAGRTSNGQTWNGRTSNGRTANGQTSNGETSTRRTSEEWRLVLPDGTKPWIRVSTFPVLDTEGHARRVVGIIEDITERKATEAALAESQYLKHTALHDGLTGLPNRALLMDRLESALARSERTQREVTVFFCDLDGFKRVNDIAGHAAGDQVLLEITRRLRSVLRDGDTVARIGGDEFVILVEPWNRNREEPADSAADRAAAIRIAERIGTAVRQPITINGVEHGVSVSIGVTHVGHPPAGHIRMTTAEEILQDADTAMYRAKSGGKDRFAIFEHGMRADVAERGRVERILRQALRPAPESDPARQGARAGSAAADRGLPTDLRWRHRRPDGIRSTRPARGHPRPQHPAGRVHPHRRGLRPDPHAGHPDA